MTNTLMIVKERSLRALYQFGDTYGKHASVGYDGGGKYWVTLTDWKTRKGGGYNDLPLKIALRKARKFTEEGKNYTAKVNRCRVKV